MTTKFDVGDEIIIPVKGRVESIEFGDEILYKVVTGDTYGNKGTIVLTDEQMRNVKRTSDFDKPNKCPLFKNCTYKTAVCACTLPDESCYWYRWFKNLTRQPKTEGRSKVKGEYND